jgi:hypothetical protein
VKDTLFRELYSIPQEELQVCISFSRKWPDCIQWMDKIMETLDIIRIKLDWLH